MGAVRPLPVAGNLMDIIKAGRGLSKQKLADLVERTFERGEFSNREKVAIDSFLGRLSVDL